MSNGDMKKQTSSLANNIVKIYGLKHASVISLCEYYADLALQAFKQFQSSNKFWNNQTKLAYNTVFSDAIIEKDALGFFLAHSVEYGVYLELANDRKNQALFPIVMRFYSRFMRDLEEIYAG
jgi:hypothetical protein